jgi:hypothetical protein
MRALSVTLVSKRYIPPPFSLSFFIDKPSPYSRAVYYIYLLCVCVCVCVRACVGERELETLFGGDNLRIEERQKRKVQAVVSWRHLIKTHGGSDRHRHTVAADACLFYSDSCVVVPPPPIYYPSCVRFSPCRLFVFSSIDFTISFFLFFLPPCLAVSCVLSSNRLS